MSSTCCNGTGFADYVAVPCSNPNFSVIIDEVIYQADINDDKVHGGFSIAITIGPDLMR